MSMLNVPGGDEYRVRLRSDRLGAACALERRQSIAQAAGATAERSNRIALCGPSMSGSRRGVRRGLHVVRRPPNDGGPMRTVVAALDSDVACFRVLTAAGALGAMMHARVKAVHVRDDAESMTAQLCAGSAGLALREVDGDVVTTLCSAASAPDVAALAVGARRSPLGPRPTGHIAERVITRLQVPVLVVPPDVSPSLSIRHVLIPIDGDPDTASALLGVMPGLRAHGVDITALHVFDAEHPVPLQDHAPHEYEAWRDDLLTETFADTGVQLQIRAGWAPEHVVDVARTTRPDLIVLAWKRRLGSTHAAVVRLVLSLSRVPVLLLDAHPAEPKPTIAGSRSQRDVVLST